MCVWKRQEVQEVLHDAFLSFSTPARSRVSEEARLGSGLKEVQMRWRRRGDWSERPPRPKVRKLTAVDKDKVSKAIGKAIVASPVLSYFKVEARLLRGRFYIEWRWNPQDSDAETSIWGRITPLADEKGALLLEVEHRQGRWSEVSRGSAQKVIRAIASDTKGTFHALGALDKILRKEKKGLVRLPVRLKGKTDFVYSRTGEQCASQEALFHYFGLPLAVIVQPQHWYSRHRTPYITEFSGDGQHILARFGAMSWSGESFGGTCLYLCREGHWGAYTIKPSESNDIASAEAWLIKRKWREWC